MTDTNTAKHGRRHPDTPPPRPIWKALRTAAHSEALALRALGPAVRCQPLNIGHIIEDEKHLRAAELQAARYARNSRRYRQQQKKAK